MTNYQPFHLEWNISSKCLLTHSATDHNNNNNSTGSLNVPVYSVSGNICRHAATEADGIHAAISINKTKMFLAKLEKTQASITFTTVDRKVWDAQITRHDTQKYIIRLGPIILPFSR